MLQLAVGKHSTLVNALSPPFNALWGKTATKLFLLIGFQDTGERTQLSCLGVPA